MNHRYCRWGWIGFALIVGCGNKKADPPPTSRDVPIAPIVTETDPPSESLRYEIRRFPTAREAFSVLLKETSPLIIGVGEIHQNEKTVGKRSALVRFTESLLPAAANQIADMVVETWVSTGRCGKTEQKVTAEVAEVTQRPAETENETIRLLKAAVAANIKPHVLEMSCDDYKRIYEADGGTDYFLLLETVGERLGEKAAAARKSRTKDKGAAKPITLIYGGALHNDVAPSDMWKDVTFGPGLAALVGPSRYLEIDLIVPEFAAASTVLQNEPWMPSVREATAREGASLIQLNPRSYLLVFPAGVKASTTPEIRQQK